MFKAPLVKADSIVPPSFTAFYVGGRCEAWEFDVEKAKKASDGGLTPARRSRCSYNEDGGHKVSVEAMAAQIEENLGIDVDIQPVAQFRIPSRTLDPAAGGLFRFAFGGLPDAERSAGAVAAVHVGRDPAGYSTLAFDEQMELACAGRRGSQGAHPGSRADRARRHGAHPLWYRTQFRVWDSDKWTGVAADFFENPTLADIGAK